MKKKFLSIVIIALMWISILYFAFGSELGTNAMAEINANYPDNIIAFDDPTERSHGYVRSEPRVLIPPSEESLQRTREQVEAFDCAMIEDVSVDECEALVALYASTNGSDWKDNTNWLQTTTVGDWYGVDTFYGGPSFLSLTYNNLVGTIPPEIGNLPDLRKLDLSSNFISGKIPAEIIQLENLEWLFLQGNLLSGSIPSEFGFKNINMIRLERNQLTGQIPASLGQAEKMRFLFLYDNQLSGQIPGELGQAPNLWDLLLNNNQLTGPIPSELGNSPSLMKLDLSSNQLSGTIPPEIGNLVNLLYIIISNNKITGAVPESITNLTKLGSDTDFGYNRLNVPQEEPVQSFLNEKDPDWHITQAIQATIPCDLGGEIISRDGKTEIMLPDGACNGQLNIILAPIIKPSHAYGQMYWRNNSFELSAWNEQGAVTQFQKPLIFTLHYTRRDAANQPERLAVELFNEDSMDWQDAVYTCWKGKYTRNIDEKWLQLPVCHLTEFGLFILPEKPYRMYVPMNMK